MAPGKQILRCISQNAGEGWDEEGRGKVWWDGGVMGRKGYREELGPEARAIYSVSQCHAPMQAHCLDMAMQMHH